MPPMALGIPVARLESGRQQGDGQHVDARRAEVGAEIEGIRNQEVDHETHKTRWARTGPPAARCLRGEFSMPSAETKDVKKRRARPPSLLGRRANRRSTVSRKPVQTASRVKTTRKPPNMSTTAMARTVAVVLGDAGGPVELAQQQQPRGGYGDEGDESSGRRRRAPRLRCRGRNWR